MNFNYWKYVPLILDNNLLERFTAWKIQHYQHKTLETRGVRIWEVLIHFQGAETPLIVLILSWCWLIIQNFDESTKLWHIVYFINPEKFYFILYNLDRVSFKNFGSILSEMIWKFWQERCTDCKWIFPGNSSITLKSLKN